MNIADLTSLPTDSLYKFMALSGLLITFASIVLAAHYYMTVQRRFLALKRGIIIHQRKLESTRRQHELARELVSQTKNDSYRALDEIKEAQSSNTAEPRVLGIQATLKSIDEMVEKNETAIAQHEIESAELAADTEELQYLADQLKSIVQIAAVGTFLGCALAGSGFYLWYTRIQTLLDHALALQSMAPK